MEKRTAAPKPFSTWANIWFSFLITDASPDVAPIHPDATPVLLLNASARADKHESIPSRKRKFGPAWISLLPCFDGT
jgi:hypothetical protein